jgi:hypothetical protein
MMMLMMMTMLSVTAAPVSVSGVGMKFVSRFPLSQEASGPGEGQAGHQLPKSAATDPPPPSEVSSSLFMK